MSAEKTTQTAITNPIYCAFQTQHPELKPEKYGYIDDQITDWTNFHTNIKPQNYTQRYNQALKENKRPAVVVFTGAFNPFHKGHNEAITLTEKAIQTLGYQNVFTHVIPANKNYIAQKSRNEKISTDSYRTSSIEKFGHTVDTTCLTHPKSPDYSSLLLHVRNLWQKQDFNQITIFHLIGEDNANFAYPVNSFNNSEIISIIVSRQQETNLDLSEKVLEQKCCQKHCKNIYLIDQNATLIELATQTKIKQLTEQKPKHRELSSTIIRATEKLAQLS